jgi:predicted ATPase
MHESADRRVFLSYRREDSAGHAGRLADHLLDRFGAGSVFMDLESIEPGADFSKTIEDAIGVADAVLVVIGPRWLDLTGPDGVRRLDAGADVVRREIEVALASQATVIPVLVDGASMPSAGQLPASIAGLAGRNAMELLDRRWRDDVTTLVDALQDRPRATAGNLPTEPTPFLGREREVAEVVGILSGPDVGVLTLTGPGGIGKTRLATRAATELAPAYLGGAWFVGLAAVTAPELVLGEIATVLGVRDVTEDSLLPALAQRLSRTRTLLVLDNLEQLLPGVAPTIAELSAAAPIVDVLASSREPLHIGAEREYRVPSLSESEAVALFVSRVEGLRPDLALGGELDRAVIAEICERLDRLPLAIELAAARVTVLSPTELLERLDQRLPLLTVGARDAPERQRTLRATIAWSYDLLPEEERALFWRLSVFSGGWTHHAAETICDADLDALQSLVERSLIRRSATQGRFEMLETIREFALEQGVDADDDLALRHAGYFLGVAEDGLPAIRGSDPDPALIVLEHEIGNLRAAVDASLDRDVAMALRLVSALTPFWERRGHWREAQSAMDAALARSEGMKLSERAAVLCDAGDLMGFVGDMAVARSLLEEAVELARELSDRRTLALALSRLAWVRVEHGLDVPSSLALGEEGVRLARELGDPWVLAEALNNMAGVSNDRDTIEPFLLESLALRRAIGDITGVADSLNNLGFAAILGGDYQAAAGYVEESLAIALRLDDRQHIALAQGNLGLVHLFDRDPDLALPVLQRNVRLCWEIGDRRIAQEGLLGLAGVASLRGEWERAAWLAGASMRLGAEGELQAHDAEGRIERELLSAAREALGAEGYDAILRRGQAASFEDAVAAI